MTFIEIALAAGALFAGVLIFTELGRRLGRLQIRKTTDGPPGSFAALEGAVFALMGLLIAFTFSAAADRFERRRQLLVDEANAIGTAWLRIDLLPSAGQPAMRVKFRQYTDTRLAFYREITNPEAATRHLAKTRTIQDEIWAQAAVETQAAPTTAPVILLLPSLNAMIDITTTGSMLARTHLPVLIRILLFILPLICALMGGLESAADPRPNWMHTILFALMLSITVYVVLDLDYPRLGLINLNSFDEVMLQLRNSMGTGT